MTTPKRPPLESLHHALKSWDPVRREGAPTEEEVARWRRRMLAAEGERRRGGAVRWRPVLVTLAAVLVLVVVWEDRLRPLPLTAPERPDAAGGEERNAGRFGTAPGLPRAGGEEGGSAAERGTPGGRRPSGEEVPTERRAADPSFLSTARPVEAGHPGEGTAIDLADAASRPVRASAQAEALDGAAGFDPAPAAPPPSLPSPRPAFDTAADSPAEPPAFREVQIIAPGGTRIVWLVAADPASPTDPSQEDT